MNPESTKKIDKHTDRQTHLHPNTDRTQCCGWLFRMKNKNQKPKKHTHTKQREKRQSFCRL